MIADDYQNIRGLCLRTQPPNCICLAALYDALGQCPHGKTVTGQATHASFTTQQSATQQPVAHPLP